MKKITSNQPALIFLAIGKNKINYDTNTQGLFINYATGEVSESASYQVTDYIWLEAGMYIYTNNTESYPFCRFVFYNDDLTYNSGQSGVAVQSFTLITPLWVRIVDSYAIKFMQLELGSTRTRMEAYNIAVTNETTPFSTKKIIFNGDSIVEGTGFTSIEQDTIIFPALTALNFNMPWVNYGIGGVRLLLMSLILQQKTQS